MLRVGSRASVAADHQLATRLHRPGRNFARLQNGIMDGLIVEDGGDGCDGLAELVLDEVFDVRLLEVAIKRWLAIHRRHQAGWRVRLRKRRWIFKVDAIEFHGVGALLDQRVNGSDVLSHDSEKNELERRDEKHPDQHRRKAEAERRPECELENEVRQRNEKRKARTNEA